MSDQPVFKTLYTPYTSRSYDVIVAIEKALKAGYAVRVESSYKPNQFDKPERIPAIHKKIRDMYLQHMQYIYAEELQIVTNEADMKDYYLLAFRGWAFQNRYRITWDTLECHHYIDHEFNGLMQARNLKHARARFDVWWAAHEYGRRPRPRHAFHIEVRRER